jgi:recombinational DNA repair protein RecT
VAKLTSGDYLTETMTLAELMQAKKMANTKTVWEQWPSEMYKKCVIKRAAKRWPLSGSAAVAVQQLIDTDNADYQLTSTTVIEKQLMPATHEIMEKVRVALMNGTTKERILARPYAFTDEQLAEINGFKGVSNV